MPKCIQSREEWMWKKLESKEISKRKIIIIHSSFEKQTLRNIKHVKLSQTETSRKRASVLRIINEQDKFYLYIVCYIHSLIVLCDHQFFTVLKISLQTTKKQKDFHLHLISFVVFKLKAPRKIVHFFIFWGNVVSTVSHDNLKSFYWNL